MKTLFFLLLSLSLLYAAEAVTPQQQIRQMIQEVQNAPEGERYKAMNRFKEMVRTMNQEDRQSAIEELKASMNAEAKESKAGQQTRTQAETGEGEQTRTREKEQVRNMQNQQMQQRSQMQKEQQLNRQLNPDMGQPKTAPKGPRGQGNGGGKIR